MESSRDREFRDALLRVNGAVKGEETHAMESNRWNV